MNCWLSRCSQTDEGHSHYTFIRHIILFPVCVHMRGKMQSFQLTTWSLYLTEPFCNISNFSQPSKKYSSAALNSVGSVSHNAGLKEQQSYFTEKQWLMCVESFLCPSSAFVGVTARQRRSSDPCFVCVAVLCGASSWTTQPEFQRCTKCSRTLNIYVIASLYVLQQRSNFKRVMSANWGRRKTPSRCIFFSNLLNEMKMDCNEPPLNRREKKKVSHASRC